MYFSLSLSVEASSLRISLCLETSSSTLCVYRSSSLPLYYCYLPTDRHRQSGLSELLLFRSPLGQLGVRQEAVQGKEPGRNLGSAILRFPIFSASSFCTRTTQQRQELTGCSYRETSSMLYLLCQVIRGERKRQLGGRTERGGKEGGNPSVHCGLFVNRAVCWCSAPS